MKYNSDENLINYLDFNEKIHWLIIFPSLSSFKSAIVIGMFIGSLFG